MIMRFGPGGPRPDDRPRTMRERVQRAFIGLSGLPQAFKLVWEAHPAHTVTLALAALFNGYI